ncbi:hypothetical protein ACOMHN_020947 [Nucella lapillus]
MDTLEKERKKRTIKEVKEKFNGLKKKYKRTQDQRNQTGHVAVTPNPYDHLIEMIIGKESEVIHGIGQKDDCEIFLLKAAEPSLPTFASTAVCQDTAKATGTGGLHPAADLPTDASLQGSSLYSSIPGTGGLHPAADLPTDASLQGSSLYSSIPDHTPADGVNIILTNVSPGCSL